MSQPNKLLTATGLTVLRLTLAAWIGGAALFVITSVAEQTSPQLDSVVRDQLAIIRFPLYYRFGFGAHIIAGLAALGLLVSGSPVWRRRAGCVLVLVLLSAVLMVLDHQYIFEPLAQLITPPGQARSQEFVRLHTWSRYANQTHVSVMLIATLIAAWPVPSRQP